MSYTPTGTAVAKFSLAVSRRWHDKASGERKEETTWFN
jgi:single-stranded DNA-binding protein